jgi:ParB-like chromosome segregation protein Spo0J
MSKLDIDERYQRELDERHVAKIVRDFDERLLDPLEVSARPDGTYAVFDGQHRYRALQRLGVTRVLCRIHERLTVAEEADLFGRRQRQRKPVHPVDQFRALCEAGDPEAIAIYATLSAHGYILGKRAGPNVIASVELLRRLYRMGVIEPTLALLRELWGGDDGSTFWPFVLALGAFVETYREDIDEATRAWLRAAPSVDLVRRARSKAGRSGVHHQAQLEPFIVEEVRKTARLRRGPREKVSTERVSMVHGQALQYLAEHPWSTSAEVVRALRCRPATCSKALRDLVAQSRLTRFRAREGYCYGLPGSPTPAQNGQPRLMARNAAEPAPDAEAALEGLPRPTPEIVALQNGEDHWVNSGGSHMRIQPVVKLIHQHQEGLSAPRITKLLGTSERRWQSQVRPAIERGTVVRYGSPGDYRYLPARPVTVKEMAPPLMETIKTAEERLKPPQGEWAQRLQVAVREEPGRTISEAAAAARVPNEKARGIIRDLIATGLVRQRGRKLYPAVGGGVHADGRPRHGALVVHPGEGVISP